MVGTTHDPCRSGSAGLAPARCLESVLPGHGGRRPRSSGACRRVPRREAGSCDCRAPVAGWAKVRAEIESTVPLPATSPKFSAGGIRSSLRWSCSGRSPCRRSCPGSLWRIGGPLRPADNPGWWPCWVMAAIAADSSGLPPGRFPRGLQWTTMADNSNHRGAHHACEPACHHAPDAIHCP